MGSPSSKEAEPVNNEQTELSNENESIVATVAAPHTFITKDEFFTTWFSWKNEFLAYLKNIDKNEENKQVWSNMLLNRIGPVGQKIYRSFPSYDKNAETDINILIKKFDIYCLRHLYGDKKRGCEDIDNYINDLKCMAIAKNYIDPVQIVKEKIIQDISTQRFTGKAALLIESKGKDLIPYLQSLDFYHLTLFWKQCEDLMAQKVEDTPKQDSSNVKSAVIECTRCGTKHKRNRCPAWGAQCNKCQQFNHFTDNCKVKYVDDCTKCGMSHIQSRCPAYGERCTKCDKRNHFSLKCKTPFVNNCSRCGTSHATTNCPAQGRTCHLCNKPNHLEEQCASKLNH